MRISHIFLSADRRLRPTWRAVLFVPVFVALLFGFSTAAFLLLGTDRFLADPELGLMLSAYVTVLSATLTTLLFLPLLDRRSYRTLGLWFYPGWRGELSVGLAGGVLLISAVVSLMALFGQVEFRAGALDGPGALSALVWYVLLLLPAATFEELVFRGYPFQRLVEGVGAFAAVLLLSALFGLVHLSNPSPTSLSTANTMLVGIVLALAYLKTRGLWLPIGLHFAWNFWLGFVFSLPVSGIELSRTLLQAKVDGPEWLSGGSYGPEGSVLTTIVILAVTFWLARTRRLGVSPALAKELEYSGEGHETGSQVGASSSASGSGLGRAGPG